MTLPLTPRGHRCALQGMGQCKEEKELESQLENDRPATLCGPPSFPGQCPNLGSSETAVSGTAFATEHRSSNNLGQWWQQGWSLGGRSST